MAMGKIYASTMRTFTLPSFCSSSDERDSRVHLLSGKALLLVFCDAFDGELELILSHMAQKPVLRGEVAFDGYNFLIDKLLGPSISLSGRGLSRSGPGKINRCYVQSTYSSACRTHIKEFGQGRTWMRIRNKPWKRSNRSRLNRKRADYRKQSNRSRLDRPRADSRTRSSMLSRQRRCRWSLRMIGLLTGSSLGR